MTLPGPQFSQDGLPDREQIEAYYTEIYFMERETQWECTSAFHRTPSWQQTKMQEVTTSFSGCQWFFTKTPCWQTPTEISELQRPITIRAAKGEEHPALSLQPVALAGFQPMGTDIILLYASPGELPGSQTKQGPTTWNTINLTKLEEDDRPLGIIGIAYALLPPATVTRSMNARQAISAYRLDKDEDEDEQRHSDMDSSQPAPAGRSADGQDPTNTAPSVQEGTVGENREQERGEMDLPAPHEAPLLLLSSPLPRITQRTTDDALMAAMEKVLNGPATTAHKQATTDTTIQMLLSAGAASLEGTCGFMILQPVKEIEERGRRRSSKKQRIRGQRFELWVLLRQQQENKPWQLRPCTPPQQRPAQMPPSRAMS
mmetsp:Transcript_15505/g.44302  ORF Transcript_15505/g.44302 Transcript_15505/m.44302 type:complete len:373 (+) Transcript_15505:309-1427(+)